ncbi:hypothetical protein F383_17366 [Gossypium arboreum]|uniref:Uncharacterized protein n=1 Tax=Gossypium arboreum TaxID=29729 RepID=A0A0B0NHD6_GOSAR|nr:hypothetical protein F383_17366 [Gossypium arboreum]
MNLKRLQGCFI